MTIRPSPVASNRLTASALSAYASAMIAAIQPSRKPVSGAVSSCGPNGNPSTLSRIAIVRTIRMMIGSNTSAHSGSGARHSGPLDGAEVNSHAVGLEIVNVQPVSGDEGE